MQENAVVNETTDFFKESAPQPDNTPHKAARTAKNGKTSKIVSLTIIYAILVLYAVVIIFPFTMVLLTSFKTPVDAANPQFELFPANGYTLDGYKNVFTFYLDGNAIDKTPGLLKGLFNTLLYIIPPTFLGLMTSSMAAYAFAKLRFRLKNIMYAFLLATMMIPGAITIAPTFSIYDTLGWIDTPLPLMIPGMFGAAACVFFMRQFFTGIPDSILEAAKLDGVGFIGIFIRIMVPLSMPAFIAQGLLGFIGGYNDYFGPLIYLQSEELYTLQIALRLFADQRGVDEPNTVMAGTLIALLPTLIIYFIAQDFFIEGIAASGVKG